MSRLRSQELAGDEAKKKPATGPLPSYPLPDLETFLRRVLWGRKVLVTTDRQCDIFIPYSTHFVSNVGFQAQ